MTWHAISGFDSRTWVRFSFSFHFVFPFFFFLVISISLLFGITLVDTLSSYFLFFCFLLTFYSIPAVPLRIFLDTPFFTFPLCLFFPSPHLISLLWFIFSILYKELICIIYKYEDVHGDDCKKMKQRCFSFSAGEHRLDSLTIIWNLQFTYILYPHYNLEKKQYSSANIMKTSQIHMKCFLGSMLLWIEQIIKEPYRW